MTTGDPHTAQPAAAAAADPRAAFHQACLELALDDGVIGHWADIEPDDGELDTGTDGGPVVRIVEITHHWPKGGGPAHREPVATHEITPAVIARGWMLLATEADRHIRQDFEQGMYIADPFDMRIATAHDHHNPDWVDTEILDWVVQYGLFGHHKHPNDRHTELR